MFLYKFSNKEVFNRNKNVWKAKITTPSSFKFHQNIETDCSWKLQSVNALL